MLGTLAAILMQAFAALPSTANAAPQVPSRVQLPLGAQSWAHLPPPDVFMRLYPQDALAKRIEGRAELECTVLPTGSLDSCRVITEEPAAEGFGQAALNAAALFQMKPAGDCGRPVECFVRLPIRFALPAAEAPPPAPQQSPSGTASFELTTTGPKAFKWLDRPNYQQMSIAMVKYSKVRSGEVDLFCWVAASGRLDACRIESENPSNVGLGNSALSLAPIFRIAPMTADGGSVAGGTLRIPFHFFSP
jgi:TonB family protein